MDVRSAIGYLVSLSRSGGSKRFRYRPPWPTTVLGYGGPVRLPIIREHLVVDREMYLMYGRRNWEYFVSAVNLTRTVGWAPAIELGIMCSEVFSNILP